MLQGIFKFKASIKCIHKFILIFRICTYCTRAQHTRVTSDALKHFLLTNNNLVTKVAKKKRDCEFVIIFTVWLDAT